VQGFPLSDREDAVQGNVVRLWANLGRFTGKSSFRTWAHSVMLNFFRDQLRAEIRWEQRHRAFRARIEQQHEPDDITPQDILGLNLSPEDTHLLTIFVKLRDYESTAEYLHITPTQLKKKLRSIIPAASK
jgi:RNA polymerase sigma factor (sigma-70 family)